MSKVDLVEGQWQTGKSMFHLKGSDVHQFVATEEGSHTVARTSTFLLSLFQEVR